MPGCSTWTTRAAPRCDPGPQAGVAARSASQVWALRLCCSTFAPFQLHTDLADAGAGAEEAQKRTRTDVLDPAYHRPILQGSLYSYAPTLD